MSREFANESYGTMQSAQLDLVVTWGAVRDELDDLEATLLRTLSTWSDDAQTAYRDGKQVWDAAGMHMQEILQQRYRAMGDVAPARRDAPQPPIDL